ncbi:hypothetical protein Tco_0396468 [Tanacetum coccineum]
MALLPVISNSTPSPYYEDTMDLQSFASEKATLEVKAFASLSCSGHGTRTRVSLASNLMYNYMSGEANASFRCDYMLRQASEADNATLVDETAQGDATFFSMIADTITEPDCNTMVVKLGYTDPRVIPDPIQNLKGIKKTFQ